MVNGKCTRDKWSKERSSFNGHQGNFFNGRSDEGEIVTGEAAFERIANEKSQKKAKKVVGGGLIILERLWDGERARRKRPWGKSIEPK